MESTRALPVFGARPAPRAAAPGAPPAGGAPLPLPRQGQLFLWLVVTAALLALGAALMALAGATAPATRAQLSLLLPLMALAVVAQHYPVSLGPGHKSTLATPVYFAALLLFGPAVAVPAAAVAQLVGQTTLALRYDAKTGRRRRGPAGVAFNTALAVLATAAGGIVYSALRPPAATGIVPLGLDGLTAAVAAGGLMFLVNTAGVATMVALQRGRRPWEVWLAARRADGLEAAVDYVLGVLLAWALAREPLLLLPVAAGVFLVHRSIQRQMALTHREAELVRRRAEAAALRDVDRMKDEFLGTVSHELRTPLSLITGFADLLTVTSPPLPRETQGMLTQIVAGTGRLTRIVDDLLDFARMQRGGLNVQPRDVDLVPVLRDVLAGFRLQPGGERLAAVLPPALAAHADPGRVAQATENFLSNALKYAPAGSVTLRAEPAPGGTNGAGKVRIEVADEGPGISAEERERIWETFFRGAGASRAPGTGIGLAVVKAVTEAQGGRVGVWSAPGRGSRFWVELPAAAG